VAFAPVSGGWVAATFVGKNFFLKKKPEKTPNLTRLFLRGGKKDPRPHRTSKISVHFFRTAHQSEKAMPDGAKRRFAH
jgi:hypothetical protein